MHHPFCPRIKHQTFVSLWIYFIYVFCVCAHWLFILRIFSLQFYINFMLSVWMPALEYGHPINTHSQWTRTAIAESSHFLSRVPIQARALCGHRLTVSPSNRTDAPGRGSHTAHTRTHTHRFGLGKGARCIRFLR